MKQIIVAIIPTFNQKKDVLDAVNSLLQQTISLSKIIVVDNASHDGTVEYLKKNINDKKVLIISNKENLGVTGGRNKGSEYGKDADFVLFFDHDMVAKPNMVEELLTVASSKNNIGIVTPKIYFWDKKDIIWSAGTDINLTTGQTLFRGGKDIGQYESDEEVAVAPAVLLVKKEVIKKVKKFDPIYFATYEDTDFCFRAKENCFLTYYAAKAVAYHKIPFDEDLSSRRLLGRAYWVGRNRIIFMKRHGKLFPFLLFLPVFFWHYLLLSLKYKNGNSMLDYIKGTLSGLFIRL